MVILVVKGQVNSLYVYFLFLYCFPFFPFYASVFSLHFYHFNCNFNFNLFFLQKTVLEVDNWHSLRALRVTHSVAQFCLLLLIMQMPCPFIFAQWCQICGERTAKKINNAQHWIHRKQVSSYTGMTVVSCNPEDVYCEACILSLAWSLILWILLIQQKAQLDIVAEFCRNLQL